MSTTGYNMKTAEFSDSVRARFSAALNWYQSTSKSIELLLCSPSEELVVKEYDCILCYRGKGIKAREKGRILRKVKTISPISLSKSLHAQPLLSGGEKKLQDTQTL